ncbi:protein NRT1/ PTR FAMILY 8.3-like [Typha angustifolia]|uniref:protein NRT1/ PTR FAMILY 8.3-like n=1 Tax=Typha angustifolia TaxID=59011 RepID=UPI003C3019C7
MESESFWREENKAPLLVKSELPRNYNDEASSGAFQEPQLRCEPTDWRAPAILLGFECLDSIAYNGIGTNLVLFLRTVLNGSNASNAANAAIWHGTSYFTPVIGAIIADTYWGNYKTIWVSLIMFLIGMILITLTTLTLTSSSSLSEVNPSQTSSGTKKTLFFFGLYLVSFGSGGVRSAVLPFGAEQFNDENPTDRERKRSYFSYFFICFIFGGIASGTFIVWIQENIDWALGYGISTLCIILALGGFLLGTPTYHLRTPNGSPLKSICQVLVASFRKISVQCPTNSNLLYEGSSNSANNFAQPKLAHTDEFRFLDKAATIHDSNHLEDNDLKSSWKICTVTQVEELKILLRFVPIWTTSIIYTSACCQMNTTFIQQGSAMDTRIGSFAIPPASLSSVEVISVMAFVLYNKVLVPKIRCWFSKDLSQLQRMGIGYFLAIIAMATAAFVEWRRLESAKKDELISIAWQLPQYVIFAVTEVFIFITLMEFFYGQAPESMKSICTALALLTVSLGQYLSSLIVTLVSVTMATEGKPGWIPDDLNKGHLDYFFWSLTGLCIVNFVTYLAFAKNYTLKKVILES